MKKGCSDAKQFFLEVTLKIRQKAMHAFAFIEVGLYSRPNSQAFSTHIREGERLAPMSRSPLPRIREFKGGIRFMHLSAHIAPL